MIPKRPDRGSRSAEHSAILNECLGHMDALYRTALRMTRNQADAEDLVQDTYLRATRSIGRYREGAGIRAWLFRILTNAYIDRYRRRQREPETVELVDEGGLYDRFLESRQGESAGDGPVTEADLEDFLRKFVGDEVKAALEALPSSFRLVLILRDVESFSYREIAEIVGVPVGTVMSRLFRARKALQQSLARYAAGHGYSPRPSRS
jgi:RNA polymerase sigma-70 factor (ECF subfamily)